MVDVGEKAVTQRMARARAEMFLGQSVLELLEEGELKSKKGPVFQTATIAAIQAVKNTSNLIPMCHPLAISGIEVMIEAIDKEHVQIDCEVRLKGQTGVEMEALTGASVAALTIYDMCKSVTHNMYIKSVRLLEKRGGKSDFTNA